MIELNETNFDEVISQDSRIAVVDIYSTTCGPCKLLLPIVEQVAEQVGDNARICKLNTADAGAILEKYMVRNVPTLLYFKNGELVNKSVGLVTKESILNKLDEI